MKRVRVSEIKKMTDDLSMKYSKACNIAIQFWKFSDTGAGYISYELYVASEMPSTITFKTFDELVDKYNELMGV